MTASIVDQYRHIRWAVEDTIRRDARVTADYADDLPLRVSNLITAYNDELDRLGQLYADQSAKLGDALEYARTLELALDVKVGFELRQASDASSSAS